MMSHIIVESVNRILKVGYNDHSDRGGGRTEHPTLQEARDVAQVWEWWFLNSIGHSTPRGSHVGRCAR